MNQKTNYKNIFEILLKRFKNLFKRLYYSISKKINFSHQTSINGTKITIPSINGVRCPNTEKWLNKLLANLLESQKGVFLDVGVNIGQTLIKIKSIDASREYIGFEPNPNCVNYVNNLIKTNKFTNCSIIPIGLYTEDKIMKLDFYSEQNTDDSASIIKNFRAKSSVVSSKYVPVFSFSSVKKNLQINNVAIIKVDVEGAELEVIQTLQKIIRTHKPVILLEMLPVYSQKNHKRLQRQKHILKKLHNLHYSFYHIQKDENIFHSIEKIESVEIHSDINKCDYLVVPEKSEELIEKIDKSG